MECVQERDNWNTFKGLQWEGCQDEHKGGVIWLHEDVRIGSYLSRHNEVGEGM